jgi:peroxiredoxin
MSMDRETLTNPGGKLPDVSLPVAGRGFSRRARGSVRRAPVLILFDQTDCEACWTYVSQLAEERGEIEEWVGEVLIVVPEPLPADQLTERALPETFSVLEDSDRRLARGLEIDPPAVVIADQWAVVRHVESASPEHHFPEAGKVVRWLRDMAIECPECEGEAL